MIRFPELETLGLVTAAFTDKSDGDCSLSTGGEAARRRACSRLGMDFEALVCGQQVHGVTVAEVDAADKGRGGSVWSEGLPDTDGLITRRAALPLAVLAADCVPVFLYDPERRAGGVIHAGREGVRQGIAAAAVEAMRLRFDCRAANIHVVIGPSAGPCCYEVSPEMAAAFEALGLPTRGRMLDLWAANRAQLEGAGVPGEQVAVSGQCTICSGAYHSYRAAPETGRNIGLFMLR